MDSVLRSRSPCFTYIPILKFIHLSSELFELVRSGSISNWDPRTEVDFQHSMTRHTDSGGSNLSSWTPSGLVLLLDKFCTLVCLLKILQSRGPTHTTDASY